MKITTRDKGEGPFDGDDISNVQRKPIESDLEKVLLTDSEDHGDLAIAKADHLIHRSAGVVDPHKDRAVGVDSRKGRINRALHHPGHSIVGDYQRATTVDKIGSTSIQLNRSGHNGHGKAGHATSLIEEEVTSQGSRRATHTQSTEGQAGLKKRHPDVWSTGQGEHFGTGSKVELVHHLQGTSVQLHADFTGSQRNRRHVESESLNTEATDDSVLIDFKVPCSSRHRDDPTSDIQSYIGGGKADAVVCALLEEEVSAQGLTGNVDLHIVGFDAEEATLGKIKIQRRSIDRDVLVNGPNGGIDSDSKAGARGEPGNINADLSVN